MMTTKAQLARHACALLALAALAQDAQASPLGLGRAQQVAHAGNGRQLAGGGGGGQGALVRVKREAAKWRSSSKSSRQLQAECLAAHNKFRRAHNVPELQWDDELAAFAQKRSIHIAASDGAEFGHPPDLPYGENLFWHSSENTACELMVRGWYDEIGLYNFERPSFAAETGHFTQVVWRDTKRVGCAQAESTGKRGGVYLTCSYDPAGNFLGEFPANVLRSATFGAAATSTRAPSPSASEASSAASASTPAGLATSTGVAATSTVRPAAASDTTTKPKSKKKNKKKKKQKKDKNKSDKKKGDKKKEKEKEKKKRKKGAKRVSSSTPAPPTAPSSAGTTIGVSVSL